MSQNVVTHPIKSLIYIRVCISKNCNSKFSEIRISLSISIPTIFHLMLYPIQLYHNSIICDIEINDIITDVLLPIHGHG